MPIPAAYNNADGGGTYATQLSAGMSFPEIMQHLLNDMARHSDEVRGPHPTESRKVYLRDLMLTPTGGEDCEECFDACILATLQAIYDAMPGISGGSGYATELTLQQVLAQQANIYIRQDSVRQALQSVLLAIESDTDKLNALSTIENLISNLYILVGPTASAGTVRGDLAALATSADTSGLATEATLNAARGFLSNIHLLMGPAGQAGTVRGDLESIRANIAAGNTSIHGYLVHDTKGAAELLQDILFTTTQTVDRLTWGPDGEELASILADIRDTVGVRPTDQNNIITLAGAQTQWQSWIYELLGPTADSGTVRGDLAALATEATLQKMALYLGYESIPVGSQSVRGLLESVRDAITACCDGTTSSPPLLPTEPEPDPPEVPSGLCQRAKWLVTVIYSKLSTIQTYARDGGGMSASFTMDVLTAIVNTAQPGLALSTTQLTDLFFDIVGVAEEMPAGLDGLAYEWTTANGGQVGWPMVCEIYNSSGPTLAKSAGDALIDGANPDKPGYKAIYRAMLSPALLNLVFSDTFSHDVSGFSNDCSGCDDSGFDCSDVVTLTSTAPWYFWPNASPPEWGVNVSTIDWDQAGSDPRLSDSATNTLGSAWTTWHVHGNFDSENEAKTVTTPARRKYLVRALATEPTAHIYMHRADGTFLDMHLFGDGTWSVVDWDDTQYVSIICSVLYDPNAPNQDQFSIEWCFDVVA